MNATEFLKSKNLIAQGCDTFDIHFEDGRKPVNLAELMEEYAAQREEPFAALTQLQRNYGYTEGEINPVALLGLFGEAGEVLNETILLDGEKKVTSLQPIVTSAICMAEVLDSIKKEIRKNPKYYPSVFIVAEDDGKKLDLEMGDVLYYLNLLALNRGRNLGYYAKLSYDKVKDKGLKPPKVENPESRIGKEYSLSTEGFWFKYRRDNNDPNVIRATLFNDGIRIKDVRVSAGYGLPEKSHHDVINYFEAGLSLDKPKNINDEN